jgi:eukaryotic-like serine/threonine-protein kinase
MNTRDQFGNYLLLKRLDEDPLGESFRAGRIGRGTVDRVVLLRVLNGQGFDPERVARSLQARSGLAQALRSPNVGQAIDVGQVRGVPYVAYDYASGCSLAQLVEQASRRNQPMPADHALLVAERVALALAVAHEVRIGDERVMHGFVVPQLVLLTNDGEVRLLGFEASTGLRESAAHPIVKQAVGRYLAPEALAGQPATRADDVYAVGALLFELLTGQPLPALPAAALAGAIDQTVVAAEGTPLPAELAQLLKRTLCPREQRVPDIVAWHRSLSQWMAQSGMAATTFNLAFFLHGLYRDEIDREARELESEKAQAAALVAAAAPASAQPAAATPAAAPSAVRTAGPVREDTNVLREEYGISKKEGRKPPVTMIAAGLGGVAVLAVAGYFLFGRSAPEAAAPPVTAPPTAPAVAAAPEETGPSEEEIRNQISEMIAQQSKQLEAGLKAQYEEQVRALQRQLDEAQRARSAPAASAPPPATTSQQVATPLVESAPAPASGSLQPAESADPRTAEPAPRPAETTAAAPRPTGAAATPTAVPSTAATPARATPTAATPAPATSVPQTADPAPVRQGELVTAGPGVTPPRLVGQPALTYPPIAQRMKKEATVLVRVLVDENGRAADVQLASDKVGFGMDDAALAYARGCRWEPASKGGVRVKMWTELRVTFKL